jgi:hypothetical protein
MIFKNGILFTYSFNLLFSSSGKPDTRTSKIHWSEKELIIGQIKCGMKETGENEEKKK